MVVNANGAHVVVWDGITCAGVTIKYRVEITQVNDSVSTEVIMASTTETILPVLQRNTEYRVSVTAVASACSSNPAVTYFMSEFEGKSTSCKWDVIVILHNKLLLILASAGSTDLASVGIGVGIAVVVVSIAIITTIIVVVLLVTKLHSKSTGKLF